MNFSDIYLVAKKINKVSLTEIELAEKELKVKFPFGYKEFLITLGSGTYCDLIYIYPPEKILKDRKFNQSIFNEAHDFWDERPLELTPDKFSELIVFTHTMDGDMLAFHPKNSGIIYVVPRHETFVYQAGINFYQAIETLFVNYGTPQNTDLRWFNSEINQCYCEMINGKEKVSKDDFLNFAGTLNLQLTDISDNDSSELFIRDFNGTIYLGNALESKQTFQIDFDCDEKTIPEKFINYFIEKGFEKISKGKKK